MIYSFAMKVRQRFRVFMQLARYCQLQGLLIQAKDAKILQLQAKELQYQRNYLNLAIGFQQALDEEDPDISEKLDDIICDVSDLVARLEEHIVA